MTTPPHRRALSPDELGARLRGLGVVPVVQIDDAADAVGLGRALAAGGLPVAEITFRTDAAADAIARLRGECPDVLVGAGTVLSTDTVDRAVAAGASFIVTPGLNPGVVEHCRARGIPVVPGVNSPTQVEQALGLGLSLLKFFPAVPSGGLPMLRALGGPYAGVTFMPTGGITLTTAPDWLALPNVAAVGGTWIATAPDIAAGHFDRITDHARAAASLVPTP
jgi:2-dehydro-3-deoxyphosphogluconate aldolase/(4S)-4-hydroxy-2-oxoglutarate aldolase